jgi:murein DD-endopeptidase MepM/ murein hydrolase activator NlpD
VSETQQERNGEVGEAADSGARYRVGGRLKAPPAHPPVRSPAASRLRLQIVLGFLLIAAAIAALVWWMSFKPEQAALHTSPSAQTKPDVPSTRAPTVEQTPAVVVQPEGALPQASPLPTYSPTPLIASPNPSGLLIPVAGVRPEQLRDTFQDSRSAGRAHDAIDIAAPRGTPVLAVADGRVVKLFESERGGTTIYQLATDNKTIYYYAHLDAYADGMAEGRFLRRGETIAYVGDTGNAGAGNYHLHFSILIVSDPKRYWDGTNINPYPLLRGTP